MRVVGITLLGITSGAVSPAIANNSWMEGLIVAENSGKIYLGGTVNFAATFDPTNAFAISRFSPYIARFNSDFTLDSTFGIGGFCFLEDFSNTAGVPNVRDWEGTDIVFAPNGQIYYSFIYGLNTGGGFTWKFGVARFNSDGTVDSSFATNGVFLFTPSGAVQLNQAKVALQSDGSIIVSSNVNVGGSGIIYMVKLHTDGMLNTSFFDPTSPFGDGGPGVWRSEGSTTFLGLGYGGAGLVIQSDDKILVSFNQTGVGGETLFSIYRLDGTTSVHDSGFGTSGLATISFPQHLGATCANILLQGTSIIGIGQAAYDVSGDFGIALCRLNSSGVLDGTFGTSGTTVQFSGIQLNDTLGTVSSFFDGTRIVVFGWSQSSTSQYYTPTRQGFSMRFDANGNIDTSFVGSGIKPIPFWNGDPSLNEELYSGLALSSNNYIFCGHINSSTSTPARAYLATLNGGAVASTLNVVNGTSPTVTTGATSSIGTTTATANATINPNSNATSWAFQYSRTSGLYTNKSTSVLVGSGSSGVGVTASLTGLTSGVAYFGRATAWSSAGGLTLGSEVIWTQL